MLSFKGGKIEKLYTQGAVGNTATFHQKVRKTVFSNDSMRSSVDDCLACILDRLVAARGTNPTMKELLKANRKLQPNLTKRKA